MQLSNRKAKMRLLLGISQLGNQTPVHYKARTMTTTMVITKTTAMAISHTTIHERSGNVRI
jgi:hypothetical protein